MIKTNFTKAEEAFEASLKKIEVQKLWDEAPGGEKSELTNEQKKAWLHLLKDELKRLQKEDSKAWVKMGLDKEMKEKLLMQSNYLMDADVVVLRDIHEKILDYRKKRKGSISNEDLIEKEKKRHKTKRFNVNEKWLPLD